MQVIGESGVQTEQIVGVSMGSLVGAMCAVEPDIQRVQAKAIELLHSPDFQQKQGKIFGAAPPPTTDGRNLGRLLCLVERMKKAFNTHRTFRRATGGPSLMSDNVLNEAIDYLLPDIDLPRCLHAAEPSWLSTC